METYNSTIEEESQLKKGQNIPETFEEGENSIVSTVYNNSAEIYDDDPETQAFFILEHEKVLEMLDIQDGQSVLDIGCGTGKYIKIFPKNINLYGLDISEKMIEKSLTKNPTIPTQYVVGDISQGIPFPDGYFDSINCSHVLKFLTSQKDLESAFQEISRVLKKGGTFVFTNNHPERNFNWDDYQLVRTNIGNTVDNNDIEIPMKLHTLRNYEEACEKASLHAEEIYDVQIDQKLQSFLTSESFSKVKGKRIIIALKLIKQ